MSKARFRSLRSRAFSCLAFGVLATCTVGMTAYGQPARQDCDDLPEAEQRLCRMMRACAGIDDADRRRECFRAVVEGNPSVSPDEVVEEPIREAEEITETARAEEVPTRDHSPQASEQRKRGWGERFRSVPLVGRLIPGRSSDRGSSSESVNSDESSADKRQPSELSRPAEESQVRSTPQVVEVFTIPKRFVATVTAIHNPGRNRRLVALDDRLLFASDRGGEGRLKVGDEVRVVKASGIFGERYNISGPARRPFPAIRIRCERLDLNDDNRRRCTLLGSD